MVNAILNQMPEANREQSRQEQLQAASSNFETEQKDIVGTEQGLPESTRQPRIVMDDEPRSEEKYIAKMPNGAFVL